jgi:hypothetical protein
MLPIETDRSVPAKRPLDDGFQFHNLFHSPVGIFKHIRKSKLLMDLLKPI